MTVRSTTGRAVIEAMHRRRQGQLFTGCPTVEPTPARTHNPARGKSNCRHCSQRVRFMAYGDEWVPLNLDGSRHTCASKGAT